MAVSNSIFRAVLFLLAVSAAGPALAAPAGYEPMPPVVEPRLRIKIEGMKQVEFLPDGQTLVTTAAFYEPIQLWDVSTGKLKLALSKDLNADSFAVCPDGKVLAVQSSLHDVALVEIQGGAARSLPETKNATLLKFDRAGGVLAVADEDGKIRLWDVKTAKPLQTLAGKGKAKAIDFSPDGSTLAVSADVEEEHFDCPFLMIWDLKKAQIIGTVEGQPEGQGTIGRGQGVRFTPDGRSIVFRRSPGTFSVWDVKEGKVVREFDAISRMMYGAMDTSASRAAAGGGDSGAKNLTIWDTASATVLCTLSGGDPTSPPVFSPEGKTLAAATWDTMIVWSIPQPAMEKPAGEAPAAQRMVGIWEATLDADPEKLRTKLRKPGMTDAALRKEIFETWVKYWAAHFIVNLQADGTFEFDINSVHLKGKWSVTFDRGRSVGLRMQAADDAPAEFIFVSQGEGWMRAEWPDLAPTDVKPRLFFRYVDPTVPAKYEAALLARIEATREVGRLLEAVDSDAAAVALAPKLADQQKKIAAMHAAEEPLFKSTSTSIINSRHYPEEALANDKLCSAAIAIQLHPARAKALGETIGRFQISDVAKATPLHVAAGDLLAAFHKNLKEASTQYQSKPMCVSAQFRSWEPTESFGRPAFLVTLVARGENGDKPARIACEVPAFMEATLKQLKPGAMVEIVAVLAPGDCTADVVKLFEGYYLVPAKE